MSDTRVRIVLYTPDHDDQLHQLLIDCSTELFGNGTVDYNGFITRHQAIYLAVFDNKVVGFSAFAINDWFGMRPATVGNTYIYIQPKYRNTRAMYLFSIQAGKVSVHYGMDLEHYYENDISLHLGERWLKGGAKMYTVFVYNAESVKAVGQRLTSKLNLKDSQ